MDKRIVKYNPAFLSKEELVRSFVVRHSELELIVQVLRENVTKSNQHVLVIGPRGIGKTMLALRVVEDIRKEKDLGERWYPLVFSEESYPVTTPGEFWLEALFHLGQQTGDDRWKRTYHELGNEKDEGRLRERALAQLMDFADAEGKRVLLVVENFNMLVGEQMHEDHGWTLRHTLLNEPRVMLLATATSRFEEIDNCGKAMFELFRTLDLKPLDEGECGILWSCVTGEELSDERIRPLQILTGGSPRLVAIISTFAVKMSFRELMDDLMQLVDDHTEYFKGYIDNLPAVERKAFLALADLWDPATAREVADAARLNVSKTSSLLSRLMGRGAVVLAKRHGRTKLYQVSERMYNIYYLMRRRGAPSRRVKALVRFMVPFYGPKELVSLTRRITEEACGLEPEARREHLWACEGILESTSKRAIHDKLIGVIPNDFLEMADIPSSIKSLVDHRKAKELAKVDKELVELLKQGDRFKKHGQVEEAERLYRKAIELAPENVLAWTSFGQFLQERVNRYEEAEEAYRKAVAVKPDYTVAHIQLGLLLEKHLNRYKEAEDVYRSVIKLEPDDATAYILLGQLLHDYTKDYDEAERSCRRAIELEPDSAYAYVLLGELLDEDPKGYGGAEGAYQKAIELEPDNHWAWEQFGQFLHKKLKRFDEAEKAYRKAIEIGPDCYLIWSYLGELLCDDLKRYEDAEKAFRKAIELNPSNARVWSHLGLSLSSGREDYKEAEEAYRKAIELEPDNHWAWEQFGRFLHKKLKRFDGAEKAYRKAIEIGPDCHLIWSYLGELLCDDLKRYEDAEKAFRKSIELKRDYITAYGRLVLLLHQELDRHEEAEEIAKVATDIEPRSGWAWAHLGLSLSWCREHYEEAEKAYLKAIELEPRKHWIWEEFGRFLHKKLERYKEAEKAYRKSIELGPNCFVIWFYLGELLQENSKRYAEAEAAFRKAVELNPKAYSALESLIVLLLKDRNRALEALEVAEDYLAGNPGDAGVRNMVAWALYEHGPQSFLNKAEKWAREAVTLEPSNAYYQHTLASILCISGKGSEALEGARGYLKDTKAVEKTINDAIDLFIGLAAGGYGREALEVLRESSSAEILEPLVVGLRMYVGEDVKAAAEIMEVGKDVVKRIEERRKKIQAEPDNEERPRAKAGDD